MQNQIATVTPNFWAHSTPAWLPKGFQVPAEMLNKVQELCKEAENIYLSIDTDGNGFLKRKEFKKAMKRLGINKFEAKHMLIFVDQERLKVVSIKNYINAYLFIKSGGLNHINADYQGPLTSSIDTRNKKGVGKVCELDAETLMKQYLSGKTSSIPFGNVAQTLFNPIPRAPTAPKDIIGWDSGFINQGTNMYLCSENGKVIANRTVRGPWEVFFFSTNTEWTNDWGREWGRFRTFRTCWNTYLTAEIFTGVMSDNRTVIGPWEIFELSIVASGGYFAFKSYHGYYLTSDAAGNVSCTATSVGPYETWYNLVLDP